MLGKEVKMGPVDLPPEAREAVNILKEKSSPCPSWCFLISTSLSCWRWMPPRKDWEWCSPTNRMMDNTILLPLEAAHHSSKLEHDGALQGVTHIHAFCGANRYNPLTYVLMMPNLDAMGHQWVGTMASFQFELEYQKGTYSRAADALSRVPISHSQQTIQSLLEGVIVRAADRGEAKANEVLLGEHEHLSWEARVQAAKLEPVHIVNWEQAQEADVALARCCKWLHLRKGMLPPRRDTLLKECLGAEAETEQGKMFFHIHNSLILNKGLIYVNMTPKVRQRECWPSSFLWVNAIWRLTRYIMMPAIKASNGPLLSLKRCSGGQ